MENSRKLDRLIQLIEGEENAPGILGKISLHDEVLFGKRGNDGLAQKVNRMWSVYHWVIAAVSAIIGYQLKDIVSLFKHI